MRGIPVALLKVDVDAVAPRVFFHNADDLRKEGILSAVGVIPESSKDTVRAIVGYRQQPFDMRPSVSILEMATPLSVMTPVRDTLKEKRPTCERRSPYAASA